MHNEIYIYIYKTLFENMKFNMTSKHKSTSRLKDTTNSVTEDTANKTIKKHDFKT